MNKSSQFVSVVIAAGLASVALIALVGFSGIAVSKLIAFAAAAALIAFAIADYSRESKSLRSTAASTQPADRAVAAGPRARASAYGLPRHRSRQIAA